MMAQEVDFSQYHSIRSAAKFAGVSPSAVRNWMLTGRLPYQENDRGYKFIHEDDLIRVMEERKAELALDTK